MTNTVAPFPTDPVLIAITEAYRNTAYVADQVLPRVPVGRQEFKYWRYPVAETFALPETLVGRRSQPNEIDLTAEEVPSATLDYGLEDPIPQADIDNAPANHSPIDRSVMQLSDYILLDREVRTAAAVFAASAYPTGHKVELTGNNRWDVAHADSTPIVDITAAIDSCLVRPNRMVLGHVAWRALSMHPTIMQALHGTTGDKGIASRRQVADLFELDEIVVGQTRLNTAKKGQAATLARVWGPHALLYHYNPNADTRGALTFGITAQWGGRVAGQERDSRIGLRGGVRVRVGESVRELVVAPRAAFLIENAVG